MAQQDQHDTCSDEEDMCKINNTNIWKIMCDSLNHNDTSQATKCVNWLTNEPITTLSQYCQTIINLSSLNNNGNKDLNVNDILDSILYCSNIDSIFCQEAPSIEVVTTLLESKKISVYFDDICQLCNSSIFGVLLTRLLQESMEYFQEKAFIQVSQLFYQIFDKQSNSYPVLFYVYVSF